MKTVVITGSARGFGYAMLELFKERDFNVVLCDVNEEALAEAKEKLDNTNGVGKVFVFKTDITKEADIQNLIDTVLPETGTIDIWINNAGVNQQNATIWDIDKRTIDKLIDIDLKGTILCSKLIMNVMKKQKFGQIFNVEGYGSNDAVTTGLSIYGTAKRAVTYFTEALAHECEEQETGVCVGKITPGIMITNFITTSLGDGAKIKLDDKTKKVYNILGDYPETIAKFMVEKIVNNTKNNVKFTWLTNKRAAWRFATSVFNKKDYFGDNQKLLS